MFKPPMMCLLYADHIPFAIAGSPGLWTLGTAFTFSPSTVGAIGSVTWSISSGSLPGWASLNTSTGAITGTPTDSADVTVTLHAVDSSSQTASKSITLAQHDAHISNVIALLHLDGANNSTTITDAVAKHTWTAHGDAKLQTADKEFGTASAVFDQTTGTYIEAATHADWAMGTGDFTIEMWVKINGAISADAGLFTVGTPSGVSMGLQGSSSGKLFCGPVNVSYGAISSSTVPTGTWTHVAACRSGTTMRVFVGGVLAGSTSDSTTYQQSFADCGSSNGGLGYVALYKGAIDEVRITKGFARYTATFTPSAFPFPAQ